MLPFLLLLFLPGFILVAVLGERRDWRLYEVVTYSLGLTVSLIFLINIPLIFLRETVVYSYLAMLVFTIMLCLGLVRGCKLKFKIRRYDLYLYLVAAILSSLFTLFYLKYPVFPRAHSADYEAHLRVTLSLVGDAGGLLNLLLYGGVDFLSAFALPLLGDVPLPNTVTVVSSVIAVVTIFPLYTVCARLFNEKVGLIASVMYVLTGGIWYVGVLNVGLFSVIFANFAILTTLAFLLDYVKGGSKTSAIFLFLSLLPLLFSHFSVVLFILALLVYWLSCLVKNRDVFRRLTPFALLFFATGIVIVILKPDYLKLMLSLGQESPVGGIYDYPVAEGLSRIPFLRYLLVVIYSPGGFVATLILSMLGLFLMKRAGGQRSTILAVWLAGIVVASPWGLMAWRFAHIALLPLTILSSVGIYFLFEWFGIISVGVRSKRNNVKVRKIIPLPVFWRILILMPVFFLLFYGGWTHTLIVDASMDRDVSRESQETVWKSIVWLRENTTGGVLALTDWRFRLLGVLSPRNIDYVPFATPDQAVKVMRDKSLYYAVITYLSTEKVDNPPNLPVEYNSSRDFTLIYRNSNVLVFLRVS